jgi:hypothetical protein
VAGNNVNMIWAGAGDLVPRELAFMRSCEDSNSKSQNNYTADQETLLLPFAMVLYRRWHKMGHSLGRIEP